LFGDIVKNTTNEERSGILSKIMIGRQVYPITNFKYVIYIDFKLLFFVMKKAWNDYWTSVQLFIIQFEFKYWTFPFGQSISSGSNFVRD
jgi:hypothetical protein